KGRSQESPLVKQAETFALYLDPPTLPKPATTKITTPGPRTTPIPDIRPKAVSTRFTLIGTTYYASHPELSLALIDEPGKGLHWVRQSGKVGHLIIEQVKDGLVVVRDGERTSELMPVRPVKKSLIKGKGTPSAKTGPKATLPASIGPKPTLPVSVGPKPTLPVSIGPKSTSIRPTAGRAKAPASIISSRSPNVSDEERAALEKLMNELQAVQGSAKSEKTGGTTRSKKEVEALMGKLLYDYKSTRISAEEAKRLDRLGKELKDVRRDPNSPRSRKIEPILLLCSGKTPGNSHRIKTSEFSIDYSFLSLSPASNQ
ncbi:MAG: hypothetical protein ACYTEO_16575, partial [Planctomycetota bacterium]